VVVVATPGTLLRGNVGGGGIVEGNVLGVANSARCPLLSAVLDGIDLIQEEFAQGMGAISGFGKAEGWERTNAVVARAVAEAVAKDPLLGAARGDAEM
jgi:hypothetical protein